MKGNQPMVLRLQPDNVYHSGINADKRSVAQAQGGVMQLVFRVRRSKRRPNVCETECLGMVSAHVWGAFDLETLYDGAERSILRLTSFSNHC